MRRLILGLFLLLAAAPLAAQDRDVGRLTAFLESQLSGAGRTVQIDGFAGALSARASLDRLTIADAQGIWLIVEDASLDWNRAAVLRGEIDITTLRADRIQLLRRPLSEDGGLPPAAATPFQLPELPVSIAIGAIETPDLVLGPDVIAPSVPQSRFSILGSARLANGSGDIRVQAQRLQGPEGRFALVASFDAATRAATLDLELTEAEGGLAATLLDLPGAPSVDLSLAGTGPLSDFSARLGLNTDGQTRLAGTVDVRQAAANGAVAVAADISGDLTALFDPELRSFFGPDLSLQVQAQNDPLDGLRLDRVSLQAAALSLEGRAEIDAEGWPRSLALNGRIGRAGDGPTRLPLPGAPVAVQSADLRLSYDRARSDQVTGQVQIAGLDLPTANVTEARLGLTGTLSPVTRLFDLGLTLQATGIATDQPDLAAAIAADVLGTAQVQGGGDRPVSVTALSIRNGDLDLSGRVDFDAPTEGVRTRFDLALQAQDLDRFAGLADRALGGRLTARLTGQATLLSGAFDIDLDGQSTDLRTGTPTLDPLFQGRSTLRLSAQRDETGLGIDALSLRSQHGQVDLSAAFGRDGPSGTLSVQIASLDRVLPGLPGPASLRADLRPTTGDRARLQASAQGPAGLALTLSGTVDPGFSDLDLRASGGAALALANPFLGTRRAAGNLRLDLGLRGRPDLRNLQGRVDLINATLTDPALPVTLRQGGGRVDLQGGQARLNVTAAGNAGGSLSLRGTVQAARPYSAGLTLALNQLVIRQGETLQSDLSGRLRIEGPLAGGPLVQGALQLGPTEIRLTQLNSGQSAAIPGLRHVGEPAAVRQTRALAGVLNTAAAPGGPDRGLPLDIQIRAPGQVFVRGRGLDAELGGALQLRGTTSDMQPQGQFSLIRGRLDLLGRRLTLTEGRASLQGSLVPDIRLLATAQNAGTQLTVALSGPANAPALTLTSDPDLPQDEALAQFLFGRGVGQLSPLQAAQLASAIVTLTGDGSPGLLDRLRASTGLDDLDLAAGSPEDGPAVRAGKYLSENVYSDVVIGADGRSAVTLNLDVSPSLTLRGTADNRGSTGLGVFFERDY